MVLAKGSETSGKAPKASESAAAPLLEAVFNTAPLPSAPPPISELGPVNDWVMSVARVGQVYTLAGTGLTTVTGPNAATQVVETQAEHNVVAYAPEMGRYLDAQLSLLKVEADIVTRFLTEHPETLSDPARLAGLMKIRDGLAQSISGVIQTIGTEGVADDWRRARMPALQAIAPEAARLLATDARSQLRTQALALAGASHDAALKTSLQTFAGVVSPAAGS